MEFLIGLIIGAGLATLVCYGLWYNDKEELDSPSGGASKENDNSNPQLD